MRARGGRAADLWQRLGFFPEEVHAKLRDWQREGNVLWVHAVSVGEVGIAAKLIREFIAQRPEARFVLTSTTPTGCAQAGNLAREHAGSVLPLFSALDGWFTVRRFLRAIGPRQIVLVEAEVWPNLVSAAHRRGIPVTLVNARLSPRSERRFLAMRSLAQPVFSMLSGVCVQEPEDVERFVTTFGISPERIFCAGSVKFDMAGDTEPAAQVAAFRELVTQLGWSDRDPVIVAASTHAGEERELAGVFTRLATQLPGLRLVLVPRHVERTARIEEELRAMGVAAVRRSILEPSAPNSTSVLLVDTTGELRAWQHLATVVVIGKSFLTKGGQNPAEAAMAGKPVVFGPHMENFDALVRVLLARGGALQVADFAELEVQLQTLLQDPALARKTASAGRDALQSHEGSTKRTVEHLLACMTTELASRAP